MPLRPSARSLEYICFHCIAINFERICYGLPRGNKDLLHLINTDGYKEVKSPFTEWPSSLLEELAIYIARYRSGSKFILYQIIQPQITSYEIYLNGSVHIAITLIGARCKNLRYLSFRESINLPTHYFNIFFKNFEWLVSLDVTGSMVDDIGFNSLATFSPHLTHLYASQTYLTDAGIRSMTISEENSETRLKELVFLDIRENRVTPGALSFFIDFHPQIQSLTFEDNFSLFDTVGFETNLQLLSSTHYGLTPDLLERAVSLAPLTREVSITEVGMSLLKNEDVYPLMNLAQLSVLHLGNFQNANPDMSFSEGIAPILSSLGHTLKKLVLENFSEIDIYAIYNFLPHLEHLALSKFISLPANFDLTDEKAFASFPKLRNIEIWNELRVWIHPQIYKLLAISSKETLSKLILRRTQTLKDEDLIHLIQGCKSLTNVLVDECNSITIQSLLFTLEERNKLSIFRCWGCERVKKEDSESLKAQKKLRNFDFFWDWHPYYPPVEEFELDEEDWVDLN